MKKWPLIWLVAAACLQACHAPNSSRVVSGPHVSKATTHSAVVFCEVQPACEVIVAWSAGGAKDQKVSSAATMHAVELTGLKAGCRYAYEILVQKGKRTVRLAAGSFATAPDQPRPFKFSVYGDSRTHPVAHRPIADAIAKEGVDFVVHTGDFTGEGGKHDRWREEFFAPAANMLRTAACFPVLGNHENKAPPFYEHFGLPYNHAWYAFSWGQIDVFVIDTESLFDTHTDQYKWLDPKVDGLTILRQLREGGSQVNVLILTAKDTLDDRVRGLDLGADDYLVKPFAFQELLARVRALIRRRYDSRSPVIRIADLEVDTAARTARRNGQAVELTAREYALLEYLALRANAVVSRTEIWQHLYDFACESSSNVVDVYIAYLRRKLEQQDLPRLIHTRRGMGYMLGLDECRMKNAE